jgi:hypothetical protein
MAVYFLCFQPSHHHLLYVTFKHHEIASPAIPLTLKLGSGYFWLTGWLLQVADQLNRLFNAYNVMKVLL